MPTESILSTPTWRDIIPPATMASLELFVPVYNRETGLKGVVTELCPDAFGHAADDYITVHVPTPRGVGYREYDRAWHPSLVSFDLDTASGFGHALRYLLAHPRRDDLNTAQHSILRGQLAIVRWAEGKTTDADRIALAQALAVLEKK